MKHFFTFLLKMIHDQRGEVGEDINDDEFLADVDEPDIPSDPEDPQDPPADPPEDPKDPPDDPEPKEEPKEDPLETLKTEYEGKIGDLQKEINRLGYALRTASKKPDKESTDEPKFSRAQLQSIMAEHKDDPAVMFQVFEELAKDAAKGAEVSATKAIDIKNKKSQMESYLGTIKGLDDDASPVSQRINKHLGELYLEDHPFGKWLAVAADTFLNFKQIEENIKEQTKKEILGKAADDKRKSTIKNNAPAKPGSPSDSSASESLTPSQMETAKMMFGNDKKAISRYAKMLARSKKSGTYQTA